MLFEFGIKRWTPSFYPSPFKSSSNHTFPFDFELNLRSVKENVLALPLLSLLCPLWICSISRFPSSLLALP